MGVNAWTMWTDSIIGGIKRRFGRNIRPEAALDCASRETSAYDGYNAGDVLVRMLTDLQAEWECRPTGGKGIMDFHFHYQRGDFHALPSDDRHQVRLHFLFFHEAELGQLDNVRDACNQFNQHYPDFKAIYSIRAERNMIYIHLVTNIRLTLWTKELEEDFADTLSLCFEASRAFRHILDEIVEKDVDNLEEYRAFNQREQYLAHETEMRHQTGDWHTYDTHHLILIDALTAILDCDDITIDHMTAMADGECIATDETTELARYDLTALMSATADGTAYFVRQRATLVIDAMLDGVHQTFILHLSAESECDDALYMRLTFVQPDRQLGPNEAMAGRSADTQRAMTFVVSFTAKNDQERQAEFDYLWREAVDCKARGLELSAEQRFVTVCESPDVAYNLYWGQRFYLAGRHYEALMHLENAFYKVRADYLNLDAEGREQFFELTYYIGVCCMMLGMHHRAYYYLDSLFNRNNLRYTQAYINALVGNRDYRALTIVDNVLKNLERVGEEQELDENNRQQLTKFIYFLRRSKARIMIEADKLDDAEKLLKSLLDDDKQHEHYILEQLARIAALRAMAASTAHSSTLSITTDFPAPERKD